MVIALCLFWGFWVIADSAQFSALVTEHADHTLVGSALSLQLASGYLVTTLTLWLVPALAAAVSWTAALAVLAIGPAIGVAAMIKLDRWEQHQPRSRSPSTGQAVGAEGSTVSPTLPPTPGAEPVDLFKALSDPVRLDLYWRILDVPEMSCTQSVNDADVSASTVSYHVKLLKSAGLVAVRKQGRNYFYSGRADPLTDLQHLFTELAAICRQNNAALPGVPERSS